MLMIIIIMNQMILCLDNYIRTKIKNIKEMIKYKHYKTIAWHQK